MTTVNRIFKVNGKPFFPLGRHRIYMAGYHVRDESEIEEQLKATKLCNANTVSCAIFWDQIEPEEGKFDFSSIDTLITLARKYELKLIPLWFATWKNAVMDYAPKYIKSNPKLYKRVIAPTGNAIWVLSSHCKATLEADKRAFAALCKHLKAFDGKEQTVIGLQVENEPGISGSDRDYSPEAQAIYDNPVPAKFMSAMKTAGKGAVYDVWQQNGGKESGTWPELFDWEAGQLMSAWSIATFIGEVAKAGKAVYDIPMLVNIWGGAGMPGEGATDPKLVNMYKWFAPYLDIAAPDGLSANPLIHQKQVAPYAEAYPLFVIESNAGLNGMLWDIADYNAIGYFVHYDQNEDGTVPPEQQRRVSLTRSMVVAIPLLLKYQGTGKIHAIEEPLSEPTRHGRGAQMELDGYWGIIQFGDRHAGMGYLHLGSKEREVERGAGLVIQANHHEFYLVGFNYRIMFRPKPTLKNMQYTLHGRDVDHPSYVNFALSVEEGHFNGKDEFVVHRQINGDDLRGGVWVGPDDSVMRVLTCD